MDLDKCAYLSMISITKTKYNHNNPHSFTIISKKNIKKNIEMTKKSKKYYNAYNNFIIISKGYDKNYYNILKVY